MELTAAMPAAVQTVAGLIMGKPLVSIIPVFTIKVLFRA